MSSYRDKIDKEKQRTFDGKIAWALERLETHPKTMMLLMRGLKETQTKEIALFDNVTVEPDGLVWYVWNHYIDGDRASYKIVRRYSDYDEMYNVLIAQSWRSI